MRCTIAILTLAVLLALLPGAVLAIPAIQKVITMLNNLVTTLDAEAKDDEMKFGHFTQWCNNEMAETSGRIESEQAKIEDTQAVLASLYSKKGELETYKGKLESDIDLTKNQIAEATQKREEEHVNFVKEQTDFENAIASCEKAVELLAAHYGDGSGPAEAVKPEFMSLMETIRKSARALSVPLGSRQKALMHGAKALHRSNFLQLQGFGDTVNNDRYQASTGEANTIVDELKTLGQTFAEDKQSAIEEENKLQATYDSLMDTKSQMLTDLQKDWEGTSAKLQQTNGDIAQNEGVLARAEKMLADQQAYMSSLQENLKDMTEAYEHRQHDRKEETTAVNHALSVLDKYNTEFLQKQTNSGRKAQGKKGGIASKVGLRQCPGCLKASSMLMSKAKIFHSSMLEAAASASASLDALGDIIDKLDGLIVRIDAEAKHEKEHKEWCEKETGLTTKKRDDHSAIVDDLKAVLANLGEVVVEKDHGLGVNKDDRTDEEMTWDDREKLRSDEKQEFEVDLQEHQEAIAALNEAISILAKYYGSKKGAALLQGDPGRGGTAVKMISETRHEFEIGKETLETDEEEAITEFTEMKAVHVQTESDLTQEKDTLQVEKQTTEQQISQGEEDLDLNKGEVLSAKEYLNQLGKSCYPLMMRYDERVKLRNEEKQAIQDAIKVLKEEA